MTCNHRHEVECGYLSPTTQAPVTFTLCEPCASMLWNKLSQPLRETYWVEPLISPFTEGAKS